MTQRSFSLLRQLVCLVMQFSLVPNPEHDDVLIAYEITHDIAANEDVPDTIRIRCTLNPQAPAQEKPSAFLTQVTRLERFSERRPDFSLQ